MLLNRPPDDRNDIIQFDSDSSLRGKFLDEVNSALSEPPPYGNDVTLTMPLFSLKGDADVAKILKELNVNGIFQKGDFSNIYDGETLRVGNILHKATIDVDPQGTVAAAATGIELVPLSAPSSTGRLVVDRPFIFIIRDVEKQFPIFMGKVMDPTRME